MSKIIVSQTEWYSFNDKFKKGELGNVRKGQGFCNYFSVPAANPDPRFEKLWNANGFEADRLLGQLVLIDCGNNQTYAPTVV